MLKWNCLVMEPILEEVVFFSSSVKIDRNIHACVYVCALRPPREASRGAGAPKYLARSQKECLLYNATSTLLSKATSSPSIQNNFVHDIFLKNNMNSIIIG